MTYIALHRLNRHVPANPLMATYGPPGSHTRCAPVRVLDLLISLFFASVQCAAFEFPSALPDRLEQLDLPYLSTDTTPSTRSRKPILKGQRKKVYIEEQHLIRVFELEC